MSQDKGQDVFSGHHLEKMLTPVADLILSSDHTNGLPKRGYRPMRGDRGQENQQGSLTLSCQSVMFGGRTVRWSITQYLCCSPQHPTVWARRHLVELGVGTIVVFPCEIVHKINRASVGHARFESMPSRLLVNFPKPSRSQCL
jgi:hypothetical protein